MATTYEERTKDELLQLAAERNIEGRSSMSKDELVAALRGESAEDADEKAAAEHQGAGREQAKDRVDKPPVKQEKGEPIGRDTPSALALEKVGPDGDGEAYAAEKKKHRWG